MYFMAATQFLFSEKKQLTQDVFELAFENQGELLNVTPGQFALFSLPSGLKRSYSIAHQKGDTFLFIIKRLENGGGGSKEICDLELGAIVNVHVPLGHFTLPNEDAPRLFVGTGTGFAPLYFQIKAALERGDKSKIRFLFGVRTFADMFYMDILDGFVRDYPNFSYVVSLSREEHEGYHFGHVTGTLKEEDLAEYATFGICGSPVMVKEVREYLANENVATENIKFEQF